MGDVTVSFGAGGGPLLPLHPANAIVNASNKTNDFVICFIINLSFYFPAEAVGHYLPIQPI
jgi:hypothetical protein